jgi:hypothetical protein
MINQPRDLALGPGQIGDREIVLADRRPATAVASTVIPLRRRWADHQRTALHMGL